MKKAKVSSRALICEEDLKPENIKTNVTIRMSGDLPDAYRALASRLGIGHQTLMPIKLREALDNPLEKRTSAIEKKHKRA